MAKRKPQRQTGNLHTFLCHDLDPTMVLMCGRSGFLDVFVINQCCHTNRHSSQTKHCTIMGNTNSRPAASATAVLSQEDAALCAELFTAASHGNDDEVALLAPLAQAKGVINQVLLSYSVSTA